MLIGTRHLQVVRAIAEAGSLTRAAARLGVSQPSLTSQLQRIEKRVGGLLFVRARQGAVPTPLGELILAKARQVLPAMEELGHETTRYTAQGEEHRRIRYGAVPGPLMAGILHRLDAHQRGEVTLRTEPSSTVLVNLVAGRHLELASILDFEDAPVRIGPELKRHVVAVEPAFLLVPAGGPLAQETEVELSDLADVTWVLPPLDDNGLRGYVSRICAVAGFTPRVAHETEASGARDLISEGQGVGLGQATFRETAGIALRPLAGTPLTIRHSLVWHRAGPFTELAALTVQLAADTYLAAVDRSPTYLRWLARHPDFDTVADLRSGNRRIPHHDDPRHVRPTEQ